MAARNARYRVEIRSYEIGCAACGDYWISEAALTEIEREPVLRGCVSVATREASDAKRPLALTRDNWRDIARTFVGTPIGVKIQRLLGLARKRSRWYGDSVMLYLDADWPLLHAYSADEAQALMLELQRRGLLSGQAGIDDLGLALTIEGWEATEPSAGGVPGLGFAAMSFDPELLPAYEDGMKLAVEIDCRLQLTRVDSGDFQEKVCDRVIGEIRRSQFVIADFTRHRGSVYFEAGFALALDRIVIWTCHEDDVAHLQFDTRQYPHLIWRTPGELRMKLADRIRALVPGAKG
jgi:hypothetical protein